MECITINNEGALGWWANIERAGYINANGDLQPTAWYFPSNHDARDAALKFALKSESNPEAHPVWVKGPPTKPGLYEVQFVMRGGREVRIIAKPEDWTSITRHSFICDIPLIPVDPPIKFPTPRGENDHFRGGDKNWTFRATSSIWLVITDDLLPPYRQTIAATAVIVYGWKTDGWLEWANMP